MKRKGRVAAAVAAGALAVLVLAAARQFPTGPTVAVPLHPISRPTPIPRWEPATVLETVPIPTGSVRTAATVPDGTNPTPATDDLLVGQGSYIVPVGSAQVAQWYEAAFARMGWRQMGSGSYGDVQSGTISQMVAFSPSLQDNLLTVNVLWAPDGHGHSTVEYWITEMVLPPKPASALLPSDIVKVVARPIFGPSGGQATRTVTNAAWIARLVKRVNGLPTSTGGVLMCPLTTGARLTLYTAEGGTIHLTAECYTVTVNGTDLADTNNVVEKMLGRLFPP